MAEKTQKKSKAISAGAKKKAKSKASAPAKKPYFTYRLDNESTGKQGLVDEGEYKFKDMGGLLRHACKNIGNQKNLRAYVFRSKSGSEYDAECLGWIMYGKLILGGDTRHGEPDEVYVGPVYLNGWDAGVYSYTRDRGYQI